MSKLLNCCENLINYLANVSTLIIMCLTTADVIARYIFKHPITGAYEITESYLMVATVCLGICSAYRAGSFIRVTFFVDRMPPQVKVALDYFIQVFSIILCVVFLIATIHQTHRSISSNRTLSFLSIPLWPAYIMVSVGFFFTTLAMVLDLWRVREGKSSLFREKSPNL